MSKKLKPCPFCGSRDVVLMRLSTMFRYACSCNSCHATSGENVFIEDAIKAWNNRPSPWHTGTPTEKGDYLCAFEMFDESIEYGWCQWDGKAWDVLCDYDYSNIEMIAWQRFEPYRENNNV